jgi:Domain of unknown function (DUF4192)
MSPDTLRLRSPADVVCAIPYLIGFHPADSVVVLACDGTRGAYAVRLDLTASEELLVHIADLVTRQGPEAVILAGYGPAVRVTPMVERLRRRLQERGVRAREALRVEDGRFWSYLCADTACCPPEGTRVDVTASPVAATAIAGGLVALPGRDELERLVAPSDDAGARQATAEAEQRLAEWKADDPDTVPARLADEGVPAVRRLLEQACAGAPPPGDEEVAWLGILLTSVRVRDEAWARMREPDLPAHTALWRHVLTRVAEPYAPAPACLLSFSAWRAGEGALANVALDRALAADPSYSMARLLAELFISGIPPSAVPLNFTPEHLDEPA